MSRSTRAGLLGTLPAVLCVLLLLPIAGAGGTPAGSGGPPPGPLARAGAHAPIVRSNSPASNHLPPAKLTHSSVGQVNGAALGPATPRVRPFSWGGHGTPPGAEVLNRLIPRGPMARPSTSADNRSPWDELSQRCFGVWPGEWGQDQYLAGCYGHDEPGIDGYSSLNGSGGNVTWAVTLPKSVNSTAGSTNGLQADLYTAIWFGLPLYDPYSWMDVCFLELQFYPDSTWTSATSSPNTWVGAAVGWQIEASTSVENPCFYQVLQTDGIPDAYFEMHGGDRVIVQMTGYEGSPAGESLQVVDQSTGHTAPVTLYNASAALPLDPAYTRSQLPNGLPWTPGGQFPVSFAFETGHTIPPFPNNNSYGGCSPGPPPSRALDRSVPCPSYDPGSWTNDTQSPWEIAPPTFFNATTSETASQVAFTQDLGGIGFIDSLSNGTCAGRDGSAWCSYPWYSYSCETHAFSFGATDWSGTTQDFGRFGQFREDLVQNGATLSFYPPTNASVPACGAPSATLGVQVGPGGSVYFLNQTYASNGSVAGLLPGEYSLGAIPSPGEEFDRWTTSGAVAVVDAADPGSAMEVTGSGTVGVVFRAAAGPGNGTWAFATPDGGSIQILRGFSAASVGPAQVETAGDALSLADGLYSINALPPIGENFSYWSVVSPRGTIAAPRLPFTWLNAEGNGTLIAHFVASSSDAWILVSVSGFGHVTFNGSNYSARTGTAYFPAPVGAYSISLHPDPGSIVYAYLFGYSVLTLGISNASFVNCENGTVEIFAVFSIAGNVTLRTSTGNGSVAWGTDSLLPPGTVEPVYFYATATLNEPIAASPPPGERFTGWTATPAVDLWVRNPVAGVTSVQINGSGNLTAHFAPVAPVGLGFRVAPTGAGTIAINGLSFSNGSTDARLDSGLYLVSFLAAPGFAPSSWSATGAAHVSGGSGSGWPTSTELVNVTGAGGVVTLTAHGYAAEVTFLVRDVVPGSASGKISVDGSPIAIGTTLPLPYGSSHLIGWASSGEAGYLDWATAGEVHVLSDNRTQADIRVDGSGALTLLLDAAFIVNVSVRLSGPPRAPVQAQFRANVSQALTNYSLTWFRPGGPQGTTASANFTAPGVYEWTLAVEPLGLLNSYVPALLSGTIAVSGALPTASLSILPSPLEAPETGTISVLAAGGAPPYTYDIALPTVGTDHVGANLTYRFTVGGVYPVTYRVRDTEGLEVIGTSQISVAPELALSANASALSGIAPLSVNFTAQTSGGAAPINLSWWIIGGPIFGAGTSARYTFPRSGSFQVVAHATDAYGVSATQVLNLSVSPAPAPIVAVLTASPDRFVIGGSTQLQIAATGGVPRYTYWWKPTSLPPGCFAADAPGAECVPAVVGNYTVVAYVNDSFGAGQSTSTSVTLTVEPIASVHPRSHGSPASPWTSSWVLAGVGGAIALVVIALALWLRPRRGTSAGTSGGSGEGAPEEYDLDIPEPPSAAGGPDPPMEWP